MGPQNQGFWPKINCSQMKLPNFVSSSGDSSSKIGHDFSNKVVQKLKLSINNFYNISIWYIIRHVLVNKSYVELYAAVKD